MDWGPTCRNILAGMAQASIEMGLVSKIRKQNTRFRVRFVNTGGVVEVVVSTSGEQVTYDGVPGTTATLELTVRGVVRSKCGKLLPTSRLRDVINGFETSFID